MKTIVRIAPRVTFAVVLRDNGRLSFAGAVPVSHVPAVEARATAILQAWRDAVRGSVGRQIAALTPTLKAAAKAAAARSSRNKPGEIDQLAHRRAGGVKERARQGREARRVACLEQLTPVVRREFRARYRLAQGKWAGGEHAVEVVLGAPSAVTATWKAWSRNGKWSGLDARTIIRVPETWVQIPVELRVVEGLLTLDATPMPAAGEGEEVYQAAWITQGRGLDVGVERGIIYRRRSRAGGAWLPYLHATSLTGARAVATRLVAAARRAGGVA